MTVYIEYVLIDNFVIDYLLLKAAYSTCGLFARKRRLFLCALIGAGLALLYPFTEKIPVASVVVKLLTGMVVTLFSGKFSSFKSYYIFYAVFLLYTFLLGGALIGAYNLFGLDYSSEFSIAIIILPAYLILKTVTAAVKTLYQRRTEARYIYEAEISLNGKTVFASAFLDTGNGVYDGENPVIFCDNNVYDKLIDGSQLFKLIKLKVSTVTGETEKPAVRGGLVKTDGGLNAENVTLCFTSEGFTSRYNVILHPALTDYGDGRKQA